MSIINIPVEAFSEILKELERSALAINYRRSIAGNGRTQTFGIVNRRSLPSDYSRNCWLRPYLYFLLLEFGKKYVDIEFNSITVNQNYKAEPHRDKNNVGDSFLVGFGDYTGGELEILEGERVGTYNIDRNPIVENFSRVLHCVKEFKGSRYSLVFYKFNSKMLDLPPPSVRIEDGKYYFYRGDEKILKLPHFNSIT